MNKISVEAVESISTATAKEDNFQEEAKNRTPKLLIKKMKEKWVIA